MKETIIHCDICGIAHSVPGKIDFRKFDGNLIKVCIGEDRPNKNALFTASHVERLDICQQCATKIEKFLANMEEENDGH